MVEKICWPDGFSCDAQLSSPRWRTLVGTSWWINALTATRWVPSRGRGNVHKHCPPCFGQLKWNYHVEEIVKKTSKRSYFNPTEALKSWLRGIGSVLQILLKITSRVNLHCVSQQPSWISSEWSWENSNESNAYNLPFQIVWCSDVNCWADLSFFNTVNRSLINVSNKSRMMLTISYMNYYRLLNVSL